MSKVPVANVKPAAPADVATLIDQYLKGGRVPRSAGYKEYKAQFIAETLGNEEHVRRFREGAPLPEGFAPGLDERVVEYPWALAHVRRGTGRILDAGSCLNKPYILGQPQLRGRQVVIWSLELDWMTLTSGVSYVWGDFRDALFLDERFDTIVCMSTLEHVGMRETPRRPYDVWKKAPHPPVDRFAYRGVLATFRRLLTRGGQLLLTVPFGVAEDLDWQQVFDLGGIRDIEAAFGGETRRERYFRYTAEGWQLAAAEQCAQSRYFDAIKDHVVLDRDHAASARAVACLELFRP